MRLGIVILVLLACSGCSLHPRWRLIGMDSSSLLVPPDVKNPALTQRTIKSAITRGSEPCPAMGDVPVEVRGKRANVTVTTSALQNQPAGALAKWASDLESSQCLAPGEGLKLAERVAESVPLDPTAAFRLLNSDVSRTGEIGLSANDRLQVMSPYWKQPGIGMLEGPVSVTADSDAHLTVTGKYTENLLGEETSVYALQPKQHGAGTAITPLYATVRMAADSSLQRHDRPAVNYFQFSADAAFYRFFIKSTGTDFTGLMIAAPTPGELVRRARILESAHEAASCELLPAHTCIALPKDIAVLPATSVRVNGTELVIARGSRLAAALVASGQTRPADVLLTLTVRKPWRGKIVPVIFDPASNAILSLTLLGGETITYTQR